MTIPSFKIKITLFDKDVLKPVEALSQKTRRNLKEKPPR